MRKFTREYLPFKCPRCGHSGIGVLRARDGIVAEYLNPAYECPSCGAKSHATNLGLAGGLAGFMFGASVLAFVLVEVYFRLGYSFIVFAGLPISVILGVAAFLIIGGRLIRWKSVTEQ